MKYALLSNVVINSLAQRLEKKVGSAPILAAGFDTWRQELLADESSVFRENPQIVFLLLHGVSLFNKSPNLGEIEPLLSCINHAKRKYPEIFFVVSTLDIPARTIRPVVECGCEMEIMARWKNEIMEMGLGVLDLHELIAETGRSNFYSSKMWYAGNMPFSCQGEEILSDRIVHILGAIKGTRKKCLILDLDNTLWGGVIGEDGLEGIDISPFKSGARFWDFQHRLKELKEEGVLLTIVSKNNKDDVMEVFNKHPYMVLRKDDFVSTRINWENKVKNIYSISEELNIGLDSMVYIDDNPFERNSVRMALPQVTVPEFPEDTTLLEPFARNLALSYFFNVRLTEEDKQKTELYIAESRRNDIKHNFENLDEYLLSLQMKLRMYRATEADVPRVAQLTQKTNQFNLTTTRYTESDVHEILGNPQWDVWIGELSDRFGEYGKVILAVISRDGNIATVENLLMSCRVMGRKIENSVMKFLEDVYRNSGIVEIQGYYVPTRKNAPVENFWTEMGYSLLQEESNGARLFFRQISHPHNRKYFAKLIVDSLV